MALPAEEPGGEGPERADSPSASTLRVLVRRHFWPYFLGNLLSNCGTWFQNIAQAILVYRLTRSTFLVGVVNFAQFAGVFALAPWAGSAADRFDRRHLLVATQTGAVVVTGGLAALSASGRASAPVVIGLALLLGLTTAFAVPALQALVPLLVTAGELAPAVALSSITFNLARAVGPVLGALVVTHLGISVAFGLNSLSYIALIAGLLAIRPRPQAPPAAHRPRLRESVRLLREEPAFATLLVVVMAVSLSSDPVNTLTPGFAVGILHRSDTLVGVLVGAFGAGAVITAFTVAGGSSDPYRRMPVTCAVLGLAMVGFGLSSSLALAVGVLALAGVGFLASMTTATTLVQLQVRDEHRGRMMALWSVAFLGVRPIGSLVDGAVAAAAGLRAAAVVMALPSLAAALLVVRFRSRTAGPAPAGQPPG